MAVSEDDLPSRGPPHLPRKEVLCRIEQSTDRRGLVCGLAAAAALGIVGRVRRVLAVVHRSEADQVPEARDPLGSGSVSF